MKYDAIFTTVSIALACIAALNFIVLIASLHRYRRSDVMQCGGCGYDVAGLHELRCPECGGLLRRLGIPAPPLQRGFSTAFMTALLLAASAVTIFGAFGISLSLIDSRWPQRVYIHDSYAAMRIDRNYIPVYEGETKGDRKRTVQICVERGPVFFGERKSLSDSMYPGLSDYTGALVVMREWSGTGADKTGTFRLAGAYTRDDDKSNALIRAKNFKMTHQVGETLKVEDADLVSQEDVNEWVNSLDLEWVVPEKPQFGYEIENTPEENVARVLLKNIKSIMSSNGSSSSTPFTGGSTGGFRQNSQVFIPRSPWVRQVFLGSLGVVCLVVLGSIVWWALRRRKKTTALRN